MKGYKGNKYFMLTILYDLKGQTWYINELSKHLKFVLILMKEFLQQHYY